VHFTEKLSKKQIGSGLWRTEWLRDRRLHVALKGQLSRSWPNTLRAQYLESWRCYWQLSLMTTNGLDSPLWGSTVGYPSDRSASCFDCAYVARQAKDVRKTCHVP